jgi:hypothetical protein
MSRWLPDLFSQFTSAIETTTVDAKPKQHPTILYLNFKELDTGFYIRNFNGFFLPAGRQV